MVALASLTFIQVAIRVVMRDLGCRVSLFGPFFLSLHSFANTIDNSGEVFLLPFRIPSLRPKILAGVGLLNLSASS